MSTINDEPAFPIHGACADNQFNGMSLRDYFAAHAPEPPDEFARGDRGHDRIIRWRFFYADAMLRARTIGATA